MATIPGTSQIGPLNSHIIEIIHMAVLNHKARYLAPNRATQSRMFPTVAMIMPMTVACSAWAISEASASMDESSRWGKAWSITTIVPTMPIIQPTCSTRPHMARHLPLDVIFVFSPNVSVHPRRTLCAVAVERLVGFHFHRLFLASRPEIVSAGLVTFVLQWWKIHCERRCQYIS